MLTVLDSWRDGWRRVRRAPAIAAGVFFMTFVLALPLAWALRGQIEAHLGRSTMAAQAADAVNYDWWQEFSSQAAGLGATFTPAIIGFAATLDNVGSVLDGLAEAMPIVAALTAYLIGWTVLVGAIIDRYARQRPTRAHGFFAAGGRHLFRLLRLAAIAALIYWLLFGYVHARLFDDWYPDLTRDLDTERRAFAIRLAMYGVFGTALLAVNVLFDYAKVRLVVEDRRSAIGALIAALRFIARNPGRVLGLYALNALTFLALVGVWALAAPGAGGAGAWMWAGFAAGQLYLLGRLMIKLQFLASATALFQTRLAHAAYAAAPVPSWPDSPSAELIGPGPAGP
jgi:hypothetical protein